MHKKRVDLHNHTKFCNHANGTMEEYVLRAIEKKIDIFGFSEHAPMNFEEEYRLKLMEMKLYESMVLQLKEKYSEQIDISLGYEVDFLEGFILSEVVNSKVDYLIGSVHFLQEKNSSLWGFDNPEFIGNYKNKDIDKIWEDYFDAIKALAKSQLFDIVGHFDLIKVFNYLPKKDIKLICKDALKEIKKSNMILEINSAGLRKPIKEQYPSKQILELAFELDIDITFGSDAHEISQVGQNYEKCKALAKEIGFTKCVSFKNREKEFLQF